MKSVKIIVSNKSIVATLAILLLAWVVYQSKDVILFLFASFIVASALFPAVDWLNKKMSRPLAVAIVYITGFLIISTMLVPFFMILSKQTHDFLIQLPHYSSLIEDKIINWQSTAKVFKLIPENKEIILSTAQFSDNLVRQSINFTINLFGAIIGVFTLSTVVLFILLDKEDLKKGLLTFFPADVREKAETIFSTISKRLGGYVRGQLFVMFALGAVTGVALAFLNIPFAFLLGMVAGILQIVTIIGPILSTVPAILLALAINPWLALAVIVVYMLIHRIENTFSPLLYGKFLELPPLVIISTLLITASTLGIIGVILSPAIAASVYVLVQELYLKKINPEMR